MMLKKELSCKMIEYILSCDDNELAHLDHHSLAETFGVSVRWLDRIFLIHAGLGVEDYIIREKIYRAILMIEQSDSITGEYISRKLGFREFRLFARQFERLMLVNPDHYIYIKKKNRKLFELGVAGMGKPPAAKLAGR